MAGSSGFAAIRSALAIPDYRNYTVGNLCSHFGTWVQRVSVQWLTWEMTGSGTWLGIIAFADLFPTVVLAPLAGAFADRIDRLKAIRITQFLALAQAAALAALTFAGLITIDSLLALTVFHGTVMALNQPLRFTVVPSLVPRENLSAAIGISSLSFNSARIAGPALAGIIIVNWGVAPAFAFNAVTYLIYIIALYMIREFRSERRGPPSPLGHIPQEIMEGYRYAINHPGIGPLIVLMSVIAVFGRPIGELMAGFADDVFHRGAEALAMMTSALGAGALLGGYRLARRGGVQGLTNTVVVNVLVLALALLGFTATDNFWIALTCIAAAGYAMVTIGVGEQTLIQNAVHGHMRGRVLSLYGMVSRGGPAIGALWMGAASSSVGLRWPVAAGAVVCVIMWFWARTRRRRLSEALEGGPDPLA
jgi:MFS family permease